MANHTSRICTNQGTDTKNVSSRLTGKLQAFGIDKSDKKYIELQCDEFTFLLAESIVNASGGVLKITNLSSTCSTKGVSIQGNYSIK